MGASSTGLRMTRAAWAVALMVAATGAMASAVPWSASAQGPGADITGVPSAVQAQGAVTATVAAAPGPITATVDRTTLTTDDVVRVTVEVNAASMQLSQLRQPVFDGFAIISNASRSQLSMINGQPSFVLSYDYVLQPARTGGLVVPPFSIDIAGQTYQTDPITLTVTPGKEPTVSPNQAAPGAATAGQRYFITASVDKADVWLGEQLTYTFRFYQAANLGQQPAYGAPPFTGFWQRRESNQRSDRVLVGDRLYLLTELDTYLFPTRAGAIQIPPSRLSLTGDLGDGRNTLSTEALTVNVRPLPDGAPAEFNGAVGRYALAATVDRAEAAVDEPIALSVTLSGDGNVETAPDPAWPAIDGWQSFDDGQTMEVEAKDGRIVGRRTWRRLLIPTRAGPNRLPALRYGYFDPSAGRYATAATEPIALTARPGAGAAAAATAPGDALDRAAGAAPGASGAPAPDPARWAAEAPLLEPAVVGAPGGGVPGWLAGGRPAAGPPMGWLGYGLLWLGPFAVIALDLGRLRRRRRRAVRRDRHAQRVTDAADAARGRLAAAAQAGAVPAVAAAEAVRAVLEAALGDRAAGLALDALEGVLVAHGVGDELSRSAVAVLRQGEASAWRPAGLAGMPGGSDAPARPNAGRTDGADADALVEALGAALARREDATGGPARIARRGPGALLVLLGLALSAPNAPTVAAADDDPPVRAAATAAAPSAAALAAAGDALYDARDLRAAAAAYAEAAAMGGLDSARAVRLGNAHVRLGEPGRAMAAYHLARAYRPRDAALRANVAWLRAQLLQGAATSAPAAPPIDGVVIQAGSPSEGPAPAPMAVFGPERARWWSAAWWASASRGWIALNTLSTVALALWWVAVVGLWIARRTARRSVAGVAVGALIAAGLCAALLGARLARRAAAVPAVVVGPGAVLVRQGPGTPFAAVRALPEGAEVRYVERRGRWLRLAEASVAEDGGGWIAASAVVDVPE